ncbi:hypothetical protein GCM10009832_02270 [Dietzia kunjamensis subsp. schimae]
MVGPAPEEPSEPEDPDEPSEPASSDPVRGPASEPGAVLCAFPVGAATIAKTVAVLTAPATNRARTPGREGARPYDGDERIGRVKGASGSSSDGHRRHGGQDGRAPAIDVTRVQMTLADAYDFC